MLIFKTGPIKFRKITGLYDQISLGYQPNSLILYCDGQLIFAGEVSDITV